MPEPSKWHQRSDPAKIGSMASVAAGAGVVGSRRSERQSKLWYAGDVSEIGEIEQLMVWFNVIRTFVETPIAVSAVESPIA